MAQVTLLVRRHGENLTRGKSLVELSTLRVFKKALDRKRQGTTEDVGVAFQDIPLVSRTPTGIVQQRTIPVRFVPLVRPPRSSVGQEA